MPYKDRAKQVSYQRQWQLRLVAQGLCRTCKAPRGRSKYKELCTRCGHAHKKANRQWNKRKGAQYSAAKRRERIEQGLCTNCGKRPTKRRRLCRKCRIEHNRCDRERERAKRTAWSEKRLQKLKKPLPPWWQR